MNKVKYFQKGSQMWAEQEGLIPPEEPKLVSTPQTEQGSTKGSVNPNFGSNFRLGAGLTPIQSYNLVTSSAPSTTPTGPTDIVDLADVDTNKRFGLFGKRADVQGLINRGFNYLDDNGQIVQVKPGTMSEEDFLTLAENARNNQSLAQKYGMGNMNGWTKDAIEFRRRQYQGSTPYMTFDPTKSAQSTTSTEGTSGKKSYNWDISFDKDGDFSWDNISTKLLQAMYANGKYDILDQMLYNGKITDEGLGAFYKTTLGQTGDKVRFDQNALQAALDGQYITQEQFNELSGLLPKATPQTEAVASAATPAATSKAGIVKDDAYWLAQAKKYGFDSFDAVKKFQQENGLLVDGKVGDQTIAALNALKSVNNSGTPSNFNQTRAYYENARGRGNRFKTTPKGGMYFKSTGYTWYPNGRVFDTVNKRKGSFMFNNNGSFNLNSIKWDKKGGKLMKYFQAGGAINQQQVAQEQGNTQREAMIELLQGLAAGRPQEAIANFANRMGVDEATADQYTQKILKDWADSVNQAKTDPETKALIGSAITNYQNYKQKYNRPAGAPASMAKQGTKLEYIQRLRGVCPEGYELKMFKAGGKVCKKCQKIEEACKGKKMEDGGESPIVQQFKNGRKCKK